MALFGTLVLLVVLPSLGCAASLRVTSLFADGVVLQTSDDGGPGARITGSVAADAAAGPSTVTLSGLPGLSPEATTDSSGAFALEFNASSGGPYTLTLAAAAGAALTIRNAMVGDVYLCAGQSNMVFPVGPGNAYPIQDGGQSIANATAEIMAAHHPDMRMWAVPSTADPGDPAPTGPNGYNGSLTPMHNLTGGCNMTCESPVPFPANATGLNFPGCPAMSQKCPLVHTWTPVTPDTVKQISGVCYIATRDVKRALSTDRAVGLIAAYIGGTPVEAYVNDADLDTKTCSIRPNSTKWPGNGRSVPCDPHAGTCSGQYQ